MMPGSTGRKSIGGRSMAAVDNPQCVIKGCVKFPCVSVAAPCWGCIYTCTVN